jgi:hypothetical protein
MQFEGALISEQGVTFGIVVVKEHILNNQWEANRVAASFQPVFAGAPIVLMAQNSRGVPTYFGRRDLVNRLAQVPMQAIPWKRYTLN